MLYGFFIGTILVLVCPIWKRVITSEMMMMMHVIAFSSSCHCEHNSWLYFDVMIILSSSKCCIQWQVHVKRHACHSHKKTSCIVNLIQHAALHIMLAASFITIYPLIVDIQQCYTICLGQLLIDMQYVLSKNLHR